MNTDPASMTHEMRLCQQIAESLWGAAISTDNEIASGRGTVYRCLERALIAAVRTAYGLSDLKARRVRDLLAELGPHDGAYGTTGHGVFSFVQYVQANRESSAYSR